jgi:hypothetical protein
MKRLIIALALVGCTKVPVPAPVVIEMKPVPFTGFWPKQEWSDLTAKQLDKFGSNLLTFFPKDADEWCMGKYHTPKHFYVALISAMSKFESSWNPNTMYVEGFKDQKGVNVVSAGLLQVSQESCKGYGTIADTHKLKDPATNLECTVRILNKWVKQDGYIGKDKLGAGRYWSVMRPGSKKEQLRKMVCK